MQDFIHQQYVVKAQGMIRDPAFILISMFQWGTHDEDSSAIQSPMTTACSLAIPENSMSMVRTGPASLVHWGLRFKVQGLGFRVSVLCFFGL